MVLPEEAKHYLASVPDSQAFRLVNGATARSIEELKSALVQCNDGTFYYHANPEKNDFANWIKGVFVYDALYLRLLPIRNRLEMVRALEETLSLLQQAQQPAQPAAAQEFAPASAQSSTLSPAPTPVPPVANPATDSPAVSPIVPTTAPPVATAVPAASPTTSPTVMDEILEFESLFASLLADIEREIFAEDF